MDNLEAVAGQGRFNEILLASDEGLLGWPAALLTAAQAACLGMGQAVMVDAAVERQHPGLQQVE